MAKNRKAAEKVILEMIDEVIEGGSENTEFYKNLFAGMSDVEFDRFMADLKDKKSRLAFNAPNLATKKLEVSRNLMLAKKWGHNFFQRIWIDNGIDPPYLTPLPYLVLPLPLRRQAQLLTKKMSVPEDSKSVDDLTGQPTGKSKGSKISYPELNVLASFGMTRTLAELVKYRGGDVDGFNAMNAAISKTGGVRLDTLDKLNTTVKSTETFAAYLTGMHLSNTLLDH